jgi:hypothetical protein
VRVARTDVVVGDRFISREMRYGGWRGEILFIHTCTLIHVYGARIVYYICVGTCTRIARGARRGRRKNSKTITVGGRIVARKIVRPLSAFLRYVLRSHFTIPYVRVAQSFPVLYFNHTRSPRRRPYSVLRENYTGPSDHRCCR